MQILLLLGAGLASSAVANVIERQACNANNCLRGVRGTYTGLQPSLSSRLADCSSFQLATVTPATSTVTVTYLTGSLSIPYPDVTARAVAPRQVTVSPTAIPAYATYCPNDSAYASACSCVGITAMTTTALTPTTTTTVYITTTITPNGPSYTCTPADSASACGGTCDGTCFPDVNGIGVCKQNRPCSGLQPCTLDSDCESDFCLVNGCGNVCAELQYLCPNSSSTKRLFRKKAPGESKRDMVATEAGMMEFDDA